MFCQSIAVSNAVSADKRGGDSVPPARARVLPQAPGEEGGAWVQPECLPSGPEWPLSSQLGWLGILAAQDRGCPRGSQGHQHRLHLTFCEQLFDCVLCSSRELLREAFVDGLLLHYLFDVWIFLGTLCRSIEVLFRFQECLSNVLDFVGLPHRAALRRNQFLSVANTVFVIPRLVLELLVLPEPSLGVARERATGVGTPENGAPTQTNQAAGSVECEMHEASRTGHRWKCGDSENDSVICGSGLYWAHSSSEALFWSA